MTPTVETPQSRCRAGVARVDVTPPVGIYHRMWGAATHDRSTGIHRPLTATALVVEPSTGGRGMADRRVLLAVDHCLLWSKELDLVFARLTQATGLPRERILIAFSHTHGAGLMGLERQTLPGGHLIPAYLESLADQLIAAVRTASADLAPATLSYSTGRCNLARNRDYWDAQTEQFVCGLNPTGFSDDTLIAVRITRDDQSMLATLVNYACHPTTLAWENTLISPDFIGAMREVVESATRAPCLFLQGASGDLGPRDNYVGDPRVADTNGRQLGYAALSALESLPPPSTHLVYRGPVISGATLGSWGNEPLPAEQAARLAAWEIKSLEIALPVRRDLPTRAEAEANIARFTAEEKQSLARGDEGTARDCRAKAERMTRWLTRLDSLPSGESSPLTAQLWRWGDVVWLFLESEHYQVLQVELRRRFPQLTLIVTTIVNGSTHTYLCPRDAYGKGIYQESVAIFAAGCLEQLIERLATELTDLTAVPSAHREGRRG